jgi:hypothetical protein
MHTPQSLKARRHGAQGFKHWSCLGLGAAPLRLSRRKPQQKAQRDGGR